MRKAEIETRWYLRTRNQNGNAVPMCNVKGDARLFICIAFGEKLGGLAEGWRKRRVAKTHNVAA
jgi:hypothetical protein